MGLVSTNRDDLYDRLKFLQNGEWKESKLTTTAREFQESTNHEIAVKVFGKRPVVPH